ncbi:MAG: nitroreductase family protein [Myxococcota bacterium]
MEYFALIDKRYSCRRYTGEPIDEEVIRKVASAAIVAPSAGNLQGYRIILVKSRDVIERLAKASYSQKCIAAANAVLAFVAEPKRSGMRYGKRGEELYSLQDATIAATFAHLAATDLGLGSVWVGAYDDRLVCEILGVSPPDKVVALLPLGIPGEAPRKRERRSFKDIVREI